MPRSRPSRVRRAVLPALAALGLAVLLSGCVAYPDYGYGYSAYPGYGYAPGYYAPGYGYPSGAYVSVGGGWGGGWHDNGWHR